VDADGDAAREASKSIVFLYKLTPGLAHRSYGLNVARLANLPRSVIDLASVKSAELERKINETRKLARAKADASILKRLVSCSSSEELAKDDDLREKLMQQRISEVEEEEGGEGAEVMEG
ncbi:Mismatch repair protein msh3, partial [Quaeritorhiza haematococci]